jgi:hypothetical protein
MICWISIKFYNIFLHRPIKLVIFHYLKYIQPKIGKASIGMGCMWFPPRGLLCSPHGSLCITAAGPTSGCENGCQYRSCLHLTASFSHQNGWESVHLVKASRTLRIRSLHLFLHKSQNKLCNICCPLDQHINK